MSLSLENHRLTSVKFQRATLAGPIIEPRILVIHYTATLEAKGVVGAFAAKNAGASAHVVVDVDGSITQMVPFNERAAHAGKSSYKGIASCNGFSIGIEIVNPGPLYQTESGYVETVRRRPWTGDVVHAKHKNGGPFIHWAVYSEAQIETVSELAALLVRSYGLTDIVGHDDISPGRKIDPGPAFPMNALTPALAERNEDGPDEFVTTTILNVRAGAGTEFLPVSGSPLAKGTPLAIVERSGTWALVRTSDAKVEGWVFARYLASR